MPMPLDNTRRSSQSINPTTETPSKKPINVVNIKHRQPSNVTDNHDHTKNHPPKTLRERSNSIASSTCSLQDYPPSHNINDDKQENKNSISSNITKKKLSNKINIKRLLLFCIPMAIAITIGVFTGIFIIPIVVALGISMMYFVLATTLESITSRPLDPIDYGECYEEIDRLYEEHNLTYEDKKSDAVEKQDAEDPSNLSNWQKIKRKLKIVGPAILGVGLIALGVIAIVASAGTVGGILALSVAVILATFFFVKAIFEYIDQRNEKLNAQLDTSNQQQISDSTHTPAIADIDSESETSSDSDTSSKYRTASEPDTNNDSEVIYGSIE